MIACQEITDEELIEAALEARKFSYAPYSKYRVGAALLTADDKVYQGCNVENASYGACSCGERTAFFKAVSQGERSFRAIAITGGTKTEIAEFAYPCGICRQVMQEFCGGDFKIIVGRSAEDYKVHTLKELLPYGFGGNSIL